MCAKENISVLIVLPLLALPQTAGSRTKQSVPKPGFECVLRHASLVLLDFQPLKS